MATDPVVNTDTNLRDMATRSKCY